MQAPTTSPLSEAERRDFQFLAGMMIPADAGYGVPGADDPAIFADMVQTLGPDAVDVRAALGVLANLAGGSFAALDVPPAELAVAALFASGGPAVTALGRVVLASYYRDERVVRALGLEPGPPFPKGRVLEQGDWSLLDVVRDRPKMWRDLV